MMIADFIKQINLPGRMIFAKVWGSHSHNTNMPSSDIDYLTVYAAPTKDILSIRPPKDTIVGSKPDYQAHEVHKFCRLLMKGNPGIVDALFTEKMCYETDEWQQLKKIRRQFLNKKTIKQYLGYAQGQLKKYDKGSYLHTIGGKPNEKWAYHMTRLLLDAERITHGREPIVWKSGAELELLMNIRTGKMKMEHIIKNALDIIDLIDNFKPWPVPDEADYEALNEWLIGVRRSWDK